MKQVAGKSSANELQNWIAEIQLSSVVLGVWAEALEDKFGSEHNLGQ